MALRHALLAALLEGEASGYQLAKRFDVSDPDQAPRMREVEIEYFQHKHRTSGVNLFTKLLAEMGELKADTLKEQASHFRPLLEQVASKAKAFIKMPHGIIAPGRIHRRHPGNSGHDINILPVEFKIVSIVCG